MWKVFISSQKVMQFVINKFVLLRFCYLYNILPWVQLDVQETYITTANFLRLWQKHELGFIECLTLEETQGQYAPTTPVYAILKTAIFILTTPRECKRQKLNRFFNKEKTGRCNNKMSWYTSNELLLLEIRTLFCFCAQNPISPFDCFNVRPY